jgi:glyoxylase-like metal-dependent hydrolase (beta-lactamase superfamily II)
MTVLTPLTPHVWLTELQLPDFDVRGVVVVGSDKGVVWDTLSHPRDMLSIPAFFPHQQPIIVYSHADWDHVWGTAGLLHHGVDIVAHAHCLQRFGEDVPAFLRQKQTAEPKKWDAVELIPPTITFSNTHTIDLGDASLELHHLPGHTPDCIVGFIPEWGILLAGDTVETPLPYLNDTDSDHKIWIAGLERWVNDPRIKQVIPAHGKIGGRELIEQTLDYLYFLDGRREWRNAGNLPPFYQETHENNQKNVKRKT